MAVTYLDTQGLKDAALMFRSNIKEFDQCVAEVEKSTNEVLGSWVGMGRNQFETQMALMKSQLDDISEGLYDIYDALVDADTAYIEEDEAVAKQFSAAMG